ncbi:MAG: hypothetical protein J4F97_03935 [Pseudomonadales bacterium]|nr:hypothetical protein [Pseudomonadales bacterium]
MAEPIEHDTEQTEATDTSCCGLRSAFGGDGPLFLGVCSGIAGLPVWRNFKTGSFEFEVKAVHIRILAIIAGVFIPRILIIVYVLAWFFVFRNSDE